jgi:hypothetical protein
MHLGAMGMWRAAVGMLTGGLSLSSLGDIQSIFKITTSRLKSNVTSWNAARSIFQAA